MAVRRKNPFFRFLTFTQLICIMLPFLAAATLHAEPLILQRTLESGLAEQTSAKSDKEWLKGIHLNENGDMVIHCGEVLLTVAYNQPDDTLRHQEQSQINLRQECPVISGISLKVSFSF